MSFIEPHIWRNQGDRTIGQFKLRVTTHPALSQIFNTKDMG